MAETQAMIGYGVDLLKGNADGPPETFTSFGLEITSLTPPSISASLVDVTNTTSPDKFTESIEGISDGGELTVDFNFIPSATDTVIALFGAGKKNWQILFPNGVKWTFSAIITAYPTAVPIESEMTASVTFKISGKPVLS